MKKRFALIFSILFALCIILPVSAMQGEVEISNLDSGESQIKKVSISEDDAVSDEGDAPACLSLDVVFIIDQSDSMAGYAGVPSNDPATQRTFAPRWAIDWLSDNALDICPDAFHRVAMISYGSEAQVDLELSNINPNDTDEWTLVRNRLKQGIGPLTLGKTNPMDAFELAAKMLDEAAPPDDSPRKKVIIFISDGEPCVESMGCLGPLNNDMDISQYAEDMNEAVAELLPFDAILLKQEMCLKELMDTYGFENMPEEKVNECLENYYVNPEELKESTYIWTMLLSKGSAYTNRLRNAYVEMSESHGGEVIDLVQNRNEIPSNFLRILTQLAGVKAHRLSCGNFAVNPYISQARLVFFKLDESTEVKISYVDGSGNSHELKNGQAVSGFDIEEHHAEGSNERYVLNEPYPGIWQIASDTCEGIEAYYEPINIDVSGGLNPLLLWTKNTTITPGTVELPEYDHEPFYNVDQEYYLQFEMRNSMGDVVEDIDSNFFGVELDTIVYGPEGYRETYDMKWVASDRVFRSINPLKLPTSGEYSISISGGVNYREEPYGPLAVEEKVEQVFNSKLPLFSLDGKKFQVFDVVPFKLEITSPEMGEDLSPIHQTIQDGWPLKINPITFRARILQEDGGMIADLNEVLLDPSTSVKAQIRSEDQQSTDVIIMQLANDGSGEYIGQVEGYSGEGIHTLFVEFQGEYKERFRPSEPVLKEELTFSRVDSTWNKVQIYYMILGIIILFIALLILRAILIRVNKVRGTLVFNHPDGSYYDEFALHSGKNWKVFKSKQLKSKGELDILGLRVSSLGRSKNKVKVQLTRRSDKKKINFEVDDIQLRNYSENSVAPFIKYHPPE
ncbi:MAG: VWA domain-containing protein [Anaerolineaceae bacterium]|nr:VWA domain-containing protein [Anaerolineaceae bacterium]